MSVGVGVGDAEQGVIKDKSACASLGGVCVCVCAGEWDEENNEQMRQTHER